MSAAVGDLRSALAEVMDLQTQGRHAQARARCELILYQRPGLPAALLLLARSLRALGELPAAHRVLSAAEAPLARLPEYRAERGRLALVAGQPVVAIRELEVAALTRPEDPDIWKDLAQAILEAGDPRVASRLRMSLSHVAAPPEAWAAAIDLFTAFGDVDSAEALAATVPEPDDPTVLFSTAKLAASTGSDQRAEELFRRMIDSGEAVADGFAGLVSVRRFRERSDPAIDEMRTLLDAPDSGVLERERIAYALAKALDDVGERTAAWEHLESANEAKRERSTAYRPQQDRRMVETLMSVFPDAGAVPAAARPDGPILIVGLPRSGTNLVEHLLAGHPSLAGAGEQLFLSRRFLMPPRTEAALRERLRPAWMEPTRRAYTAMLRMTGGEGRVMDRYPANFFNLGFFVHMFPAGRIVHCRRDLTDNALSIYMQDFPMGNAYANAPEDIAQFATLYQRLMNHWKDVLGERLVEVDYEALVEDPEASLRPVLDSLGLDWDPACANAERERGQTRPQAAWQVRQPLHRNSVGRSADYPDFNERFLTALERARSGIS